MFSMGGGIGGGTAMPPALAPTSPAIDPTQTSPGGLLPDTMIGGSGGSGGAGDPQDPGDPIVRPAWLTDEMYQMWYDFYLEAGADGAVATDKFRESPQYDTFFPGIRRDDGMIRYDRDPEETYFNNIAAFRNTIDSLDMNPDAFNEDYIALIMGDVSPNEFTQRVNALESRVMSQGPAIRDYYSDQFGVDMTREGILGSLMSERVEQAIFEKNITMAELGGSAAQRGFDMNNEFVNLLANEGMDRREAQQLFGAAENMLPFLGALARRHADPKDDFDIEEFTQATFLEDPEQLGRLNRLRAQEQSVFTGGAEIEFQRSRQTGGLTGLVQT